MAYGDKIVARWNYNGWFSDEFIIVEGLDVDPERDIALVCDDLNESGAYPNLWFEPVSILTSGEVMPYPKKWV